MRPHKQKREPIVVLFAVVLSALAMQANAQPVPETAVKELSGVRIEVRHLHTYASASKIVIEYVVTNSSSGPLRIIQATPIFNLRVRLVSPSGDIVTPFPYDNKEFSLFLAATIEPGKKHEGTIDLAHYFPIAATGNYRCTITKRVYEQDSRSILSNPQDRQGKPIDLEAPEFGFHVAALDPTPRQPPQAWLGDLPGPELNGIRPNDPANDGQSSGAARDSSFSSDAHRNQPATIGNSPSPQSPTSPHSAMVSTSFPDAWAWIVALLLVIAALAGIALLWRRSPR